MKKLILSSLVVALFAANAFAGKFSVDNVHSNVDFTIRHLVSNVRGSFTDFSGEFSFDEKTGDKLEAVKFTIQANSVNTMNTKRDEHLRSPDFFDVAKYPTLEFVGKSAKKTGKNKFKLAGDLTMHGVTKPVTFDVDYLGIGPNMMGGRVAGFKATTQLNRKDFGIIWNKTLDKGSLALGDQVTVNLNIEAAPVEAAAAPADATKPKK